MGKREFPLFLPSEFRTTVMRERVVVRYPFNTFSPFKSRDEILF
jgi:hypothetical protein